MGLKIFALFFIMLFSLSLVSAFNWDTTADFTKNDLTSKYGKYEIFDKNFLFFKGDKLKDVELKENTETCGQYCEEIQEQTLYKDGALIEDRRYYRIYEDGTRELSNIRSDKFYIQTKQEEIEVADYEWKCVGTGVYNKNGTEEKSCSNVQVGTHIEYKPVWEEYNIGDIKPAGTYIIKHTGEKRPDWAYDWQIKTNGIWSEEWAVWGGFSVDTGLVRAWQFNEGAGWWTNSSIGTSPLAVNSSNWATGKYQYGYKPFNYTLSDFNPNGLNAITISLWINRSGAISGDSAIYGTGAGAFQGTFAFAFPNNNDKLITTVYDTVTQQQVSIAENINRGQFSNVVLMLNSSNAYIYVNGTFSAKDDLTSFAFANYPLYLFDSDASYQSFGNEGIIDEIYIWNRTLSAGEVSNLWNSGTGLFYGSGSITLNAPEDGANLSSSLVTFNASVSTQGGVEIVNMSLWTNSTGTWKLNQTLEKTGTTNTSIFTLEISDTILWAVQACDSDGECGISENRTITIDTTYPIINIAYPMGIINYGYIGQNVSLNYTITDTNLQTCWHNYNGSNVTIPCSTNTSLILSDKTNITIWANDSVGNTVSEFGSWNFILFGNLTDINSTYETSRLTLNLNLNYNASIYTIGASLNYNGTIVSATNNGTGNNANFIAIFDVPLTNTSINKSYFWTITLANSTYSSTFNTATQNQLVIPINFTLCSAGINISAINFTIYDEINDTIINATLFTNAKYWLGSGSVYKTFNYNQTNLTQSVYSLCKSNSENFSVDIDASFNNPNYLNDRQYYLRNYSFGNFLDVKLKMITSAYGQKFFFDVRNGISILSEAVITITKYNFLTGAYDFIGHRLTDVDGKFIEYLELDKSYRFAPSKNGVDYATIEKSAICTASPCELNLQVTPENYSFYEGRDNYFASRVSYELYYNKTLKSVIYSFTDLTGTANYFRLLVTKLNDTEVVICDDYLYSVAGSLVCNLTNQDGEFMYKGFVSRSPERVVNYGTISQYLIGGGLGFAGLLLGFIFLLVLIFALSSAGGEFNPTIGISALCLGFIALKLFGILTIGWTSIVVIIILSIVVIKAVDT